MAVNTDPPTVTAEVHPQLPSHGLQAVAFIGFLALSAAAWALASIPIILNLGGWFAAAANAPWMPPGWMFRSMWMALYAGVAVAAWLVWRRGAMVGGTLAGYTAQLLLNAAWPATFFGLFPILGPAALWAAFAVICAWTLEMLCLSARLRMSKKRRIRSLAA